MQIEIGTVEWILVSLGALVFLLLTSNPIFALYCSLGAVVFGQVITAGILDWMER